MPRTILSASVLITDYQHSGCRWGRRESICVQSGPNPDLIIGEANVQNPSLQQTCHLDFPPKLGSNSIFKLQLAEMGGACQSVDFMAGWARLIQCNSSAAKIPMHTFFLVWLPAADIGGTHNSASSIVKQNSKQDSKLKSVILRKRHQDSLEC